MDNNIKIDDISTSDCNILNTIVNENYIKILFDRIYNLQKNCYMENVNIFIKGWKTLKNTKYISKEPFDKNTKEIISNEYEEHEIIQEIENKNGTIIFKGFSKNDGCWMENIFEECIIEIK